MKYDVFISYARKNNLPLSPNESGWISKLVEELKKVHRKYSTTDLKIFFDVDEIKTMDDWEHRLLEAIRSSSQMLVFLSPDYFASAYCGREWKEFLPHERSWKVGLEGIAPIYFIRAPDFHGNKGDGFLGEWVSDLRRRQTLDLRHYSAKGSSAFETNEIRELLEGLDFQIADRIERIARARESPGTVDRPNPKFIGRRIELRRLRELLSLRKIGTITTIHGLPGMGKTALAVEYAHTFAGEYVGGRWTVRCENEVDLGVALLQLGSQLGIEFSENELKDKLLSLNKIFSELESLCYQGNSNKCEGKCLLILDNVSTPNLLSTFSVDKIPCKEWINVLATTRIGPEELNENNEYLEFLSLDELPEEDAVNLIATHQPGGGFSSNADEDCAYEIVRQLGHYTLAVEAVAMYLGTTDVPMDGFLSRLCEQGVRASEDVARSQLVANSIRHQEGLLEIAFEQTLEKLKSENLISFFLMRAAALLPPDCIPLPWLRSAAESQFPELVEPPKNGYPDPWARATRKLLGLRIFLPTAEHRIVTMHRLLQNLVRNRFERELKTNTKRPMWIPRLRKKNGLSMDEIGRFLAIHASEQATLLSESWYRKDCRWELEPLKRFSDLLIGGGNKLGEALAVNLFTAVMELGRFSEGQVLVQKALAASEKNWGPNHGLSIILLGNLAAAYHQLGDYKIAEKTYRNAILKSEEVFGKTHMNTSRCLLGLAGVLIKTGNLKEAESIIKSQVNELRMSLGETHPEYLSALGDLACLHAANGDLEAAVEASRDAFEGRSKVYGNDHPSVISSMNNLAQLLKELGKIAEADDLFQIAYEKNRQLLDSSHPSVILSMNNNAGILKEKGDLSTAEELYTKALSLSKKELGVDDKLTLTLINNLAGLMQAKGDFVSAEKLFRDALQASEERVGLEHPDSAMFLNNLVQLHRVAEDSRHLKFLSEKALKISDKTIESITPFGLEMLNTLGDMSSKMNHLSLAEKILRKALKIRERTLGQKDNGTVLNRVALVNILLKTKPYRKIKSYLKDTVKICEEVWGTEDKTSKALRALYQLKK